MKRLNEFFDSFAAGFGFTAGILAAVLLLALVAKSFH